jgi:hypothetical protein
VAERINRNLVPPRAQKTITAKEWRLIVDEYLSGKEPRDIAKRQERAETAIRNVLFKVASDYAEEGKREAPVSKLSRAASVLDFNREPTKRDVSYLRRLRKGGRTLLECSAICHLSPERLKAIRVGFFGLFDLEEERANVVRPRARKRSP